MSYIQREIIPLNEEDLFIVLNHPEADFEYATHFHSDYELNLVLNSSGNRIVGDSIEVFEAFDLVLTGPNLPHGWKGTKEGNHVVTIQFDENFLNFPILSKRMFIPIREMLVKSARGIQFLGYTNEHLKRKILNICELTSFNASLEFLSLLYDLSISPQQRFLASNSFDINTVVLESRSRRISHICNYINDNYMNPIKLSDIAGEINMSESALSHFFKKRTNRNLIEYINDIRIGYATKMLFETTHSIAEVCFQSGFNNISNFNRIFKKSKGVTPSEYRTNIHQILIKF